MILTLSRNHKIIRHKNKNSRFLILNIKQLLQNMNNTKDEKFESAVSEKHSNADESKYQDADSELYLTIQENHPDFENSISQKQLYIRQLTETEGCFESPIDICLTNAKDIRLKPLEWVHFEVPPKKIKVTNTGLSIIMSAKWKQERPYLQGGPFTGKYVFSSWHLHWGKDPMEGSEHTIDGSKYPAEMHVVTFKSSYLTQEAALKEQDGCTTLVYIFKLQETPNPDFQIIVDALSEIKNPGMSKKIEIRPITNLVRKFKDDYFMYWGSVSTQKCTHYILWLITRVPIGVSAEQVDALRFIFDTEGKMLTRNFRDTQDFHNRTLFHVCPSASKFATLLSVPNEKHVSQTYRCEVYYENTNIKM